MVVSVDENKHDAVLIRNVQALEEEKRELLYAELRLKHAMHATFIVRDETVIAMFAITGHNVIRLYEYYHLDFTLQEGKLERKRKGVTW